MWFLRWVPFALAHGHDLLVTHHLNYPDGVNLMWNTSLPLPGLLLAPVTDAWGPVLSFNLLLVLAYGLSAWCAYLAIRRFVPGHLAAAVGGLIYGFSPAMRVQSHHLHMSLAFLVAADAAGHARDPGPPAALALAGRHRPRPDGRRPAPDRRGAAGHDRAARLRDAPAGGADQPAAGAGAVAVRRQGVRGRPGDGVGDHRLAAVGAVRRAAADPRRHPEDQLLQRPPELHPARLAPGADLGRRRSSWWTASPAATRPTWGCRCCWSWSCSGSAGAPARWSGWGWP